MHYARNTRVLRAVLHTVFLALREKAKQGNTEEAAALPFLEMHQQQKRVQKEQQKKKYQQHTLQPASPDTDHQQHFVKKKKESQTSVRLKKK